MLKHEDIIRGLSDSDKIHILGNVRNLSGKRYRLAGIPEISVGDMRTLCDGEYPSARALVCSWDERLIRAGAIHGANAAAEDGAKLVLCESPMAAIAPLSRSLGEEPLLSAMYVAEQARAVKERGMIPVLSGLGLDTVEALWQDEELDGTFVERFVTQPFGKLSDKAYVERIGQKDLCTAIERDRVIRLKVSAKETAACVTRGETFLEGSEEALDAALTRYKQLKKSIENGGATSEELNAAVSEGKAVSPESIDEAVDRIIELARNVSEARRDIGAERDEGLEAEALLCSSVLVENKGALPLKKGSKVALIGDIAETLGLFGEISEKLVSAGYLVTGSCRGYDITRDRDPNESLLRGARDLAKEADTAVVFLGKCTSRYGAAKNSSLPANQQHLLYALAAARVKIVAIMCHGYTLTQTLSRDCSALMLTDLEARRSASAVAGMLSGEYAPSGRLASCLYTDKQVATLKRFKRGEGIRTGMLVGYRYCCTAGESSEYPFGHGLTYTSFAYSGITVSGGKLRFTVKNVGKRAGTETAQVYIGLEDSSVLRPDKELIGYRRLSLEAGASETVEMDIGYHLNIPKVADPVTGEPVIEKGAYKIYVGASSADTRLTATLSAGERELTSDGKRRCDYIHSESNIILDNFKMEAEIETMKRSSFNFIIGGSSIGLAMILKLYCAFSGAEALFFDLFAAFLAVFGVAMFIMETVKRNRQYNEARTLAAEKTAHAFEDAEHLPAYNAEMMFREEFDTEAENVTEVQESHADEAEYFKHIDKEQSFATAARDFERFAVEKGYKLSSDTVKSIFASMAASRLLVLRDMSKAEISSLVTLLSAYFDSPVFIDSATGFDSDEAVLFRRNASGDRAKTEVFHAVEAARNASERVHIAAITDVSPTELSSYFSSYARFAGNPMGGCSVAAVNEGGVHTTYLLPSNLWFVLGLSENAKLTELPDFVSEVASVCKISADKVTPAAEYSHFSKVSSYQIDYLCDRLASAASIDEDMWKKIDRLVELVGAYAPYRVGNKMWLCLEKYALVMASCECEPAHAVDAATAAKLLPAVLSAVQGKIGEDDRSVGEIVESVFGEYGADACLNLIKATGAQM